MKTILVATDFSERSDRAVTRAAMIAARAKVRLHLVHVVDDDQNQRIIDGETTLSRQLLTEEAERLDRTDGLTCTSEIVLGDPFEAIGRAAGAVGADLVVLGAHRRRLLRDVFVGTTAQRVIRRARQPVLMVNAPPDAAYHSVLLSTDLSETSRGALVRFMDLGLTDRQDHALVHIFDAPAQHLALQSALGPRQMDRYRGELKLEADRELDDFAKALPGGPFEKITRPPETGISAAILQAASWVAADLIVVAGQGRVGLGKTFLGSVAEEVLRRADRDVVVIPPAEAG